MWERAIAAATAAVFRLVLAFAFFLQQLGPLPAHAASATASGKVALVIGNSAYGKIPDLKNPRNDAGLISDSLKRLGFNVILREDASHGDIEKAINELLVASKDAETVMFYFAGHGFQLGGRNFLVPVDAGLENRDAIGKETFALDKIIETIHERGKQTLVFLDACRNNPIPAAARTGQDAEGLAQIETGSGTFVAFATEPGKVTFDGAGENSPFATALSATIEEPGISISDMMIRVRNAVEEATEQTQTPWDQSSLRSQFYFNPVEEENEALTEEDLALLSELDPALLEKFKKKFGLKIVAKESDEGGESLEAEGGGEIIASIEPTLIIQDVEPAEPAGSAAERTAAASPAEPVQPQEAVDAGLIILSADEGEPGVPAADAAIPAPVARPAEKPVEMAALEPKSESGTAGNKNQRVAPAEGAAAPPPPAAPIPAKPAAVPVPEGSAAIASSPPKPAPATAVAPSPAAKPAAAAAPAPKPAVPSPQSPTAAAPAQPSASGPSPSAAQPAPPKPAVAPPAPAAVAKAEPPAAPAAPSVTPAPVAKPAAVSPPPVAKAEPTVVAPPASNDKPSAPSVASAPPAKPVTGAPTLTPAPKAVAAPPPAKTPAIEKPVDTATLAPQEQKPGLTKETLPAVVPSPAEAPAIDKPVEMAALAPQEQKPGPSKETIPAADLPVVTDPDELRKETEKRQAFARLAGQAQQELARLGCFRSGSDGEWGAKSARALLRYYGAKKLEPDIVEPTEELVSRLKAETKVVCSNTETAKPKASQKKPATAPAAKKPAKAAPVASNSGGAPKKKAESAGQKKPSPPKSATEIKKKLTTKPIIGAF